MGKLKQDSKEAGRKVKALEDEVACMLVQTLKLQGPKPTTRLPKSVCCIERTALSNSWVAWLPSSPVLPPLKGAPRVCCSHAAMRREREISYCPVRPKR